MHLSIRGLSFKLIPGNPDSPIDSQFKFWIELCRQLVQPLLDLKASTRCPPSLRVKQGQKPVLVSLANIFHTNPLKEDDVLFAAIRRLLVGRGETQKHRHIIVPSVMRSSALVNVLKYSTLVPNIDMNSCCCFLDVAVYFYLCNWFLDHLDSGTARQSHILNLYCVCIMTLYSNTIFAKNYEPSELHLN